MTQVADSRSTHWVNRTPESIRPYLQLSRLDRPIGYWLLTLPGWIGLALPAFICLPGQRWWSPLYWGVLILIGAVAMRGAGCTYNDIVDRDLDAKVDRTRSRPLPSGRVSVRQASMWISAQLTLGFVIWLALPFGAKLIALASLPLVAAYPFMKRITWWPQVWLGLTFNWAVLVAYAIQIGGLDLRVTLIYFGLVCWTVGYDTIYAVQDLEDDALIGVKSTARRFGGHLKAGVATFYALSCIFITCGLFLSPDPRTAFAIAPFALHLLWQVFRLRDDRALSLFKSNAFAALFLILGLMTFKFGMPLTPM